MAKVIGATLVVVGVFTGNWGLAIQGASIYHGAEQAGRAKRRARAEYLASLQDRTEMVDVQAAAPRSLALGRVRAVEGLRFPPWTSGTRSEKLTMIVSFASHEIDGFEQFFFDDTALTLDAQGWVLTEPYFKSRAVSKSFESASTTITLPETPMAGTVTCVAFTSGSGGEGSSNSQPAAVLSVVGATVTVEAVDGAFVYSVLYQVASGTSTARIRTFPGGAGQNVGAALAAEYPGKIDATRRFEGMAVAVVDLLYDTDVYIRGRPNVSALFRGARCYDPRKDSTAGGSGAHRYADPATWEWTENPALHALRYATWQNGWALGAADLRLDDVRAAADVCDEVTAFPVRTGGVLGTVTLPRYRCGITISSDADARASMDDIVQTMAGMDGWAGGTWRLKAGAVEASAFAVQSNWLVQVQGDDGRPSGDAVARITNGVPRDQRLNRITGQCIDPAQRWQALPYPATEDAVLIATKGLAAAEIDMPGVSHHVHAQHLARVLIRQAQASMRLELRCGMPAWPVELYDRGTLELPRFGFAGNGVRVTGWRWHPTDGITLQLAETAPAIYEPTAELTGLDPAPNLPAPDPRAVPRVSGVSVSSGTVELTDGSVLTRTRVSWSAVTAESVRAGGAIEVQYVQAIDGEPLPDAWPSWVESGAATDAVIPALLAGQVYVFRARAITAPPLQVRGDWSVQVLHQVALPPVVAGRYTDYVFRRSATQPPTPTGVDPADWFDAPPAADGNPLWVSFVDRRADGSLLGAYSVPVQIDGASVQVQYSVDGVTAWHDEFVPGDKWARYRVGGATAAWSGAIKIVGEDGGYTSYIFIRSLTQPATPTGSSPAGWSDGPPAPDGNPLWVSVVRRNGAGEPTGAWSAPVEIDGKSLQVEWSADGVTGWHADPITGDKWARYRVGGSAAWSAAVKVAGEDGPRGLTGAAGARGTVERYLAGYSAWDNAAATAAVPDGVPVVGDVVVQYNNTNFAQTRTWSGAAWILPGQVIDGGLLVNGTVTAAKINVLNLAALSGVMGNLTSGTITGAVIRTAASGPRVVLDHVTNTLEGIGPGGVSTFLLDANEGKVGIDGNSPIGVLSVANSGSGTAATFARSGAGYTVAVVNSGGTGHAMQVAAYGSGTGLKAVSVSGYGVDCDGLMRSTRQLTISSGPTTEAPMRLPVIPYPGPLPPPVAGGIAAHAGHGFLISEGTTWFRLNATYVPVNQATGA